MSRWSHFDLEARYGKPRFQVFRVSEKLRLSIEYGLTGGIAVIQMAQEEFRGFNPHQPLELSSQTADTIFERILPGITNTGMASEENLPCLDPDFVRAIHRVPGATLFRDYPLTGRTMMIAATLVTVAIDVSRELADCVAPFGHPEYEQFRTRRGPCIGARYGQDGAVYTIQISMEKNLLRPKSYSESGFAIEAAEDLLEELWPAAVRGPQVTWGRTSWHTYSIHSNRMVWQQYSPAEAHGAGISWAGE